MKLGVISDTHGYLSPQVLDAFSQAKVDRILHAGDIGPLRLLAALEAIAPVTAVRGNCDFDSYVRLSERIRLEGVVIHLVHKPQQLSHLLRSEQTSGTVLGIHGHLHIPGYTEEEETAHSKDNASASARHSDHSPARKRIILCPGSPTEPRAGSSPTIATVELADAGVRSHTFIEI